MSGRSIGTKANVGGICLLAYLILASYEVARATTESLFLTAYGSESLPRVWGAVALVTLLVVTLYNRNAARQPLLSLLGGATLVTAGVLVVLNLLLGSHVPHATFFLYVWKDVHIVVVLEILWSFANVVFRTQTARWLYGVFCAAGSLGSMSGGYIAGSFSDRFGTEATLWLPMLFYTGVVAVILALRSRMDDVRPPAGDRPKHGDGLRVLRKSRYLGWLLLLVLTVQIAITLVDYLYNRSLESSFADTDERTRIIGLVYAAIALGSLVFQFMTGPILRFVGSPLTLLSIPVLLSTSIGVFVAFPQFLMLAITKVASKLLDYSLFKAAKEMLYIPLSYAEKTRGKAMIDMLTYRLAKGGASLLLIGILALGWDDLTIWATLFTVVTWFGITVVIARRYRQLVPRAQELRGRADG
jgi:AAA family ATP:ADP antiporter